MNQEILLKKILECSAKNKKSLSSVAEQVSALKRQQSETDNKKYQAYKSEYNQLLKLNKESEQQNYRLKKELAVIQTQIEELSFRNQLSRSRIKNQNEEIQNIKDETFDIDKQKRKDEVLAREYEEMKRQRDQLQKEVELLQQNFDRKRKNLAGRQEEYQQKQVRKQYLLQLHQQNINKRQQRAQQLQQELRSLKSEVDYYSRRKENEEKTKRRQKDKAIFEIKQLVNRHKYSIRTQ